MRFLTLLPTTIPLVSALACAGAKHGSSSAARPDQNAEQAGAATNLGSTDILEAVRGKLGQYQQAPRATGNKAEEAERSYLTEPTPAELSKFSDTFTFNYETVKSSERMKCFKSLQARPWPHDVRRLLAQEFRLFPQYETIRENIQGFYVVTATDPEEDSAGLTCHDSEAGKYVIFVFEKFLENEREARKGRWDRPLEKRLPAGDRRARMIDIDQVICTFVHELFHVFDDFNYYADATPTDLWEKRDALQALSWSDYDDPKFSTIAKKASAPPIDSAKRPTRTESLARRRAVAISTVGHINRGNGFLDSARLPQFQFIATPTREITRLFEKSNFFEDYSMKNAMEDFAETAVNYYMMTRHNQHSSFTIYDRDVIESTDGAKVEYSYDTLDMAKRSAKHREKICAYARTVFGEDCQQTLASP